jgi:dienelactone hydrolase
MRLRVAVVALLALALAGCGAPHRDPLLPQADPIDQAATATGSAARLAFAAERYRTPVFPTTAPYATATYATRPDLVTGQPIDLKMTVYTPLDDPAATRPLIVWVHGGGFIAGTRGEMATTARQWAQLGYVTATIDYRLDPGSKCVQVQLGLYSGATLAAERARCERAIYAARDDAAAAVSWLRTNASRYRIDPTRIVIGGGSAGAITAVHVGQTLNVPGSPPPAASKVSAVLAMSGCNYVTGSIDAADAPVAMLASGGDWLVPYSCSVATVDGAARLGTPTWRNLYPQESAHAQDLYRQHQAEIDRGWRLFLIDALALP